MNQLDQYIARTYDALGTKYSCAICHSFAPSRLITLKGWGKAAKLKRLVRQHIKDKHPETDAQLARLRERGGL